MTSSTIAVLWCAFIISADTFSDLFGGEVLILTLDSIGAAGQIFSEGEISIKPVQAHAINILTKDINKDRSPCRLVNFVSHERIRGFVSLPAQTAMKKPKICVRTLTKFEDFIFIVFCIYWNSKMHHMKIVQLIRSYFQLIGRLFAKFFGKIL